jgi:hypothetical protein
VQAHELTCKMFSLCILCMQVAWTSKGLSLAGMLSVNALMLACFVKALQQSGSTAASVINTSVNFLSSVSDTALIA